MKSRDQKTDDVQHYLRKELLELIKKDTSILDFLENGSLDGMWFWDLENPENEWMSERFWTTLGYDPEEMPHKSSAWKNIIFEDDLKKANRNFENHCRNPDHKYDQLVRYRHKDGSIVWIRCRGVAIRDELGKPIRMLGVHADVSDLKHAELRMDQNEFFEAVIKSSPSGMVVVGENGRIILANAKMEALFGYEEGDLLGQPIDMLIPDAHRNTHAEHRRKYHANPQKREMGAGNKDLQGRRKDGSLITIEVGLSPLRINNELLTIASILDLTQRKETETQLKALNTQLSLANEGLEKFARMAAHDLTSPLATMGSILELMTVEIEEGRSVDELKHWVDLLNRNLESGRSLVHDLLRFARIGNADLRLSTPKLSDLVHKVTESIRELIDRSNAVVTCESLEKTITCDEGLLIHVLQNIVANAIKYRRDEEPRVRINLVDLDGSDTIIIEDNGRGISDSECSKVFDPFYRLEEDASDQGSGLGLSIAKRIVEAHNGKIWVESDVDVGSKFYITLKE